MSYIWQIFPPTADIPNQWYPQVPAAPPQRVVVPPSQTLLSSEPIAPAIPTQWWPSLPTMAVPRRRPPSYQKLAMVGTGEALPLRWQGRGYDLPMPRTKLVPPPSWVGPVEPPTAPVPTWFTGEAPPPPPRVHLVPEGGVVLPLLDTAFPLVTVVPGQAVPPTRLVSEGWQAYPFPAATDAAPPLAVAIPGQAVPPTRLVAEGWYATSYLAGYAQLPPFSYGWDSQPLILPPPTWLLAGGMVAPFSVAVPPPGLTSWGPRYPDHADRLTYLHAAHPWQLPQNQDPIAQPPAPDLSWGPSMPAWVLGRVLPPQLPPWWTSVVTQPPPPDDRVFLASTQLPPPRRLGAILTTPTYTFPGEPPPVPPLAWKGVWQDFILRRGFPLLPFEVDAAAMMHVLIAQSLAWRGSGPALLFRRQAVDIPGQHVEVILPAVVADAYPCLELGLNAADAPTLTLSGSPAQITDLQVQSPSITAWAVCGG